MQLGADLITVLQFAVVDAVYTTTSVPGYVYEGFTAACIMCTVATVCR